MNLLSQFEGIILGIHFLVCAFMILVIMLQSGKGTDITATMGGGSSQSLFGPRGAASFLSRLTTIGAFIFLATSISLSALHKIETQSTDAPSVFDKLEEVPNPAPAPEEQPATDKEADKAPDIQTKQ